MALDLNTFHNVADVEAHAVRTLPRAALDYYRSGADAARTLRDNRAAFAKYKFMPKMLIDVSKRDLSVNLLQRRMKASMPVGVAPTAMQRMAHPDGECANAKAAEAAGAVFILSTISTSSIEEVAQSAPNAVKWFQLYIYKVFQQMFPYKTGIELFNSLTTARFYRVHPPTKMNMKSEYIISISINT